MNQLWVLIFCLLAFACLALGMERPQEDLFGRHLSRRSITWLRIAGWVLLALSLGVTLDQERWAVGLVAWFGYLSAGAAIVFLALVAWNRLRQPDAKAARR
jgi:hypothetical protein